MDDPVDQVLGQGVVVALVDGEKAAELVLDDVLVEEAVLGPGQERAARGPPRSGGGGADFFAFFRRKNWGNRPS